MQFCLVVEAFFCHRLLEIGIECFHAFYQSFYHVGGIFGERSGHLVEVAFNEIFFQRDCRIERFIQ